MHIGFLTPEYPHPKSTPSGGLGTSIKNLAASLVSQGEKVSVIIYGQKKDLQFEENGIFFHFIKQVNYKFLGWYFYRKYLEKYLNRICEKEKIDIVEAPDWTGITAFMKLRKPLVIRMNGSDAYFCCLEERKQKWKNRFFEGVALKNSDMLVSVSKFTAELTKDIFKLKKEISIIPNSIQVDNFEPKTKKKNSEKILYFGTIIRKKGVLELAEIFNRVIAEKPDAKLTFIGKDSIDVFEEVSTLKLVKNRLSSEAIRNFSYLKEVEYSEIKEYIMDAEVIVLPSFAEALPMTWLEAMAMEKALVTSNIGWSKEVMIDGKTGFTEDPKDHRAYAEKILYLLNNSNEAKKMGKAARKRVKQIFSTTVIGKKNLTFYEGVLIKGVR